MFEGAFFLSGASSLLICLINNGFAPLARLGLSRTGACVVAAVPAASVNRWSPGSTQYRKPCGPRRPGPTLRDSLHLPCELHRCRARCERCDHSCRCDTENRTLPRAHIKVARSPRETSRHDRATSASPRLSPTRADRLAGSERPFVWADAEHSIHTPSRRSRTCRAKARITLRGLPWTQGNPQGRVHRIAAECVRGLTCCHEYGLAEWRRPRSWPSPWCCSWSTERPGRPWLRCRRGQCGRGPSATQRP